jgi:peptide/nickel transport system ATP-binding protein
MAGARVSPLLEVKDLTVSFPTSDGLVQAVRGVTFTVEAGRTLGIVGESGSGKTVLTQTLLGLTPGADVSGQAVFSGTDLLKLSEDRLRRVRGAQISVIFQDPLTSLHPLYKVGWQIVEMIRAHDRSPASRRPPSVPSTCCAGWAFPGRSSACTTIRTSSPAGCGQRAMIAMALALSPQLIIADEPTTALDATVQAQVLDLLIRLQAEFGTALILITHDLGVVADIADDVMVMYAGRAAEQASKHDAFYQPHHPYTKGLLESIPSSSAAAERLRPITGQPPSLIRLPTGCPFHPRCAYVMDRCVSEEPPLAAVGSGLFHRSACFLPARATGMAADSEKLRQSAVGAGRHAAGMEVAGTITASPEAEGG